MECVGAVIELGKKTENLDDRIEKLEQHIAHDESTVASVSESSEIEDSKTEKIEIKESIETNDDRIGIENKNSKIKKIDQSNNYDIKPLSFLNWFINYEKKDKTLTQADKKKKFSKCTPKCIKIVLGIVILSIAFGYI